MSLQAICTPHRPEIKVSCLTIPYGDVMLNIKSNSYGDYRYRPTSDHRKLAEAETDIIPAPEDVESLG